MVVNIAVLVHLNKRGPFVFHRAFVNPVHALHIHIECPGDECAAGGYGYRDRVDRVIDRSGGRCR